MKRRLKSYGKDLDEGGMEEGSWGPDFPVVNCTPNRDPSTRSSVSVTCPIYL